MERGCLAQGPHVGLQEFNQLGVFVSWNCNTTLCNNQAWKDPGTAPDPGPSKELEGGLGPKPNDPHWEENTRY